MRSLGGTLRLGGLAAFLLLIGSPTSSDAAESKPALPRWRDKGGMVFVRGGQFVYRGREVRVRSFYMDQYEVTNEQFCQFLNEGDADHWHADQEIEKVGGRFVPKASKQSWPVYAVSWHNADAYAPRRAGKRLPTDAEWLFAAAGKEKRQYAWGDESITPDRANYGGHLGHPQPVGSYPLGRSPDGIYDLTGNVAEWCHDWYDPQYVPAVDSPAGPEEGERKIRRAGCYAMQAESEVNTEFGTPSPAYRPKCIGFRCVRPTRRVLILLGENFAELEFGAYTAVMSWASHTHPQGNYVMPKTGAPSVPHIEAVVAGFDPEVHGMGSMTIRPHVLVKDLTEDEIDRFDAVAVPACVGSGRGRHTYQGWEDISSDRAAVIIRRVHTNGGVISTMCAGQVALEKAGLPYPQASPERPVAYAPDLRTATSAGPAVAVEAACMLLKQLVRDNEYRSFRRYNPWLFGENDQFPPRLESLR